ncbi:MAG TPA: aldose epimerase family protein [bacterium]|nr:aldose epimerase family protein [bacterium]HPN42222.1 aldose epimerase family protein [bacterium]
MDYRFLFMIVAVAFCLIACCAPANKGLISVNSKLFGTTADGKPVTLYTLVNSNGMEAQIMTYGASLVALKTPDKNGKLDDIITGFDSLKQYEDVRFFFGAIVGRYGNRIGKGKFSLDGVEYTLATNNGANHLHGGNIGFDKVVWEGQVVETPAGPAVKLTYVSKDGEEGYPGNLTAVVTYSITADNSLKIEYSATSDKKTVVNLTNHAYYNLKNSGDILGHVLYINADNTTPVDAGLIPTGELASVKDTPFDFTTAKAIGKDIDSQDQQMLYGGGYDHNFVLNKSGADTTLAATLYEPETGRMMEIWTTEPAIQFYSGNFLDGTITGKYGRVYEKRTSLCLETQHYPDSPNQPEFPSTVLEPGKTYSTVTIMKFSAK